MTPAEATILARIECALRERVQYGHGNAAFWVEMAELVAALDAERARQRATLLAAVLTPRVAEAVQS